jgi:hypothetical protein
MSTNDVIGIVVGLATIYLLWQQNRIFRQQNAIFAAQAGGSTMPSENSTLRRFGRYWPMFAMTTLMFLTWAAIWYDYHDRHRASGPQTSVRVFIAEFTTYGSASTPDDLQPGKPTAMNLGVNNFGPLPALDVSFAAQIRWFNLMTKSVEDDQWNEFIRSTAPKPPVDLDINSGTWATPISLPLSDDDIREIKLGKKNLYIFIHYSYRDVGGQHDTEFCQFLTTPITVIKPGLLKPVWQQCQGHHKIR